MNSESSTLSPPAGGAVITFYSFKGGTGRSMAAANVACLLGLSASETREPRRVLLIDWDLEAPGLHRYFGGEADDSRSPGLIDYFGELTASPNLPSHGDCTPDVLEAVVALEKHVIREVAPGVDFMRAGAFGPDYARKVAEFDWTGLFSAPGNPLKAFRELLRKRYAFTLIDSRTGLTDESGICTMVLPETLVTVFTPNRQSLDGAVDVASRAIAYRSNSADVRPLTVFPVPSRVENAELALKREWRFNYEKAFESAFIKEYQLEACTLTSYFDDVQLPHVSQYAYGERVAVREERNEFGSLYRGYNALLNRLLAELPPWQRLDGVIGAPQSDAPLTRQVDETLREAYEGTRLVTGPTQAWVKSGKDRSQLLEGTRLDDAERWVASTKHIEPAEAEMLLASAEYRREQEVAALKARLADQTSAQTKMTIGLIGLGVATILVIAMALLLHASDAQARAADEAARARIAQQLQEQAVQSQQLADRLNAEDRQLAEAAQKSKEEAAAAAKEASDAKKNLDAAKRALLVTQADRKQAESNVQKATQALYEAQTKQHEAEIDAQQAKKRADDINAQAKNAMNELQLAKQRAQDAADQQTHARELAEAALSSEHAARTRADQDLAGARQQLLDCQNDAANCTKKATACSDELGHCKQQIDSLKARPAGQVSPQDQH